MDRAGRLDPRGAPAAEQANGKVGYPADQQNLQEQSQHAGTTAEAAAKAAAEQHAEQAGTEHAAHQAGEERIARHEAAGLRRGRSGSRRLLRLLLRRRAPFHGFRARRGLGGRGCLVRVAAATAGTRARTGAGLGQ